MPPTPWRPLPGDDVSSFVANGYESAISTQLMATNCCICGRPLLDADSVGTGVGPICREKFLPRVMSYDVDQGLLAHAVSMCPPALRKAIASDVENEAWRELVNKAIWHASMAVSYTGPESKEVLAAVQQLTAAVGAERVAERLKKFYVSAKIKVSQRADGRIGARTPRNERFIEAVKKIPGRRWHGQPEFIWSVPANMVDQLIAALSAGFPGEIMEDMNGNVAVIPRDAQFPPPKTNAAPGPSTATGEKGAPPIEEIQKLKKGDKVLDRDGNQRVIGWVGQSRGEWRLGLRKPGESGMEFVSYVDVKLITPVKAAAEASSRYKEEASSASSSGAPPPPPPRTARAVPEIAFPYQIDGIGWLDQKRSGLLADEPGLGKTLQACVAADPPVLVVCPAAMRIEWAREMNRWRPELKVLVVAGEKAYASERYQADVVVVNYDILGAHLKALGKIPWATLIGDEAHYLKTLKLSRGKYSGSSRAKAFVELAENAGRRFLLTATPIMNRPIELWPLLHILDRDRWDSYSGYGKRYCNGKLETVVARGGRTVTAWDFSGSSNQSELNALLVSTYMLRRTKDILPLPPKSRQSKLVALDGEAGREYDQAAKEFLRWVEEQGGPEKVQKAKSALALTKMTALRRLAAVGKVPYAVDWIVSHFEATGKPLVVMAHHRDVTQGIEAELLSREVESPQGTRRLRVGKIIGGMAEAQRTADKDAFQAGRLDVLVCSIQAAGVGLTLTAASETLFVERAWRPSDLVQAEDRIWRIGQDNKCTITYLDAAGTIDETIGEMLKSKQSTIAGVIDGVDLSEEEATEFVFGTMFGLTGKSGLKENPRRAPLQIAWGMASEF